MSRQGRWAASLIGVLGLPGCEHASSVDVLGSFFPIWIVCIVAGIALTLGARLALTQVDLESELGPPIIVYPGMVVLFSCAIWLLCFRP